MNFLEELIATIAARCRGEAQNFLACVLAAVRRTGRSLALCLMAAILTLWALGLLVAALFIGLAPHLGAHWAAMICAGACLLTAVTLLVIGSWVAK